MCLVSTGDTRLLCDDPSSDSDADSDELLEELSSELDRFSWALLFVVRFTFFWLSLGTSFFLLAATFGGGGGGGGDSLGNLPLCLLASGDGDADCLVLRRVSFGGLSERSWLRLLRIPSTRCLSSEEGDCFFRFLLSSLDELRRRFLSSGVISRRIRPLALLSPFLELKFSLCCGRRFSSLSRESSFLVVILDCSGMGLDFRRLVSGLSSSGSRRPSDRSSEELRASRCFLFFLTSDDFSAELDRSTRRCCLSRTPFSDNDRSFSGDCRSPFPLRRSLTRSPRTRSSGE